MGLIVLYAVLPLLPRAQQCRGVYAPMSHTLQMRLELGFAHDSDFHVSCVFSYIMLLSVFFKLFESSVTLP